MMAFAAEYRNASTFLRTSDLSLDEMIAVMAAHGFKPLLARRPKTEARSVNTIYRYQDIAMAFGLRTDPTVIDDPEFQEL